eukprot:GHVS01073275.1.p1 GENE.GHVS01073275.1~~GHVS01073275.1.p1  ORF type:complete len:265 (+),score=18.96 GHVS01073275.1:50-796(+)
MSAVPDTYSSPAVQGAQPSQGIALNHQTFGNCGESGMPDQSEENVPLKGRGLGLLISDISTTFLVAITLVGDFMSHYTARKVLEPIILVGLAVVTIIFFLERRKKLATKKIIYLSIASLSIAVVLVLVQLYSLIAICYDLAHYNNMDERFGVFILFIVLVGVASIFIIGFGAAFQCSMREGSARKSVRHEPPIVQVVLPPQAANYGAPEVQMSTKQYDTAGTSAFYSNAQPKAQRHSSYYEEQNSWKQ